MSMLEVKGLQKTYVSRFGGNCVEALKNVNFTVEEGEYVAIMGESGSGKTTLLNILAALDQPTGGSVLLDGQGSVARIREQEHRRLPPRQSGLCVSGVQSAGHLFPARTTSSCRWCWRANRTPRCAGASRPLAKQLGIDGSAEKVSL